MKWLLVLFFGSFVLGQLGALPIGTGITIYSHDVVLGILLLAAFFSFKQKRRAKSLLFHPIAVFSITAAVSLLVNVGNFSQNELFVASLYLARWIFYASIYWVVIRSSMRFSFWLLGLYSAGSVLAILGLIQYFFYPYLRNLYYLGWDPHLYRVFSTLLDPNFAGVLFIFTLFLGIYLWSKEKKRLLVFISGFITLVAFLLTYSRSSYLAFLAGLMVFFLTTKRWKLGLLIVSAFLAVLFFLPKPSGEGVKLLRTVSTLARIGNWQRGAKLIGETPIFGHGFNTLRYVQQAKGWVDESEFPSKAGAGLDNSFEFVWATTGIVGFLAYMWLLSRMFRLGFHRVQQKTHGLLGPGLVASLTSLVVHSQFQNSLFYPWVLLWMWIFAGSVERSTSDS